MTKVTSPLRAALISGAAKALGFPEGHPLRATPPGDPIAIAAALERLRQQLIFLDPAITDAVAASSFDGSPERRNLNLRLYLGSEGSDQPDAAVLAALVFKALECAWAFTEFLPADFSVLVWRGARQVPPYDNSAKIDLAPVLDRLDIDSVHVFKKFLTVSSFDMEQRFGPRLGVNP